MQNNIDACLNTTKNKIRLSPTKRKLNYKLSRPPKKTKATLDVQKQDVSTQTSMQTVAPQMPKHTNAAPKLITSKYQILCEYPDVFDGISNLPGLSYHIQIDPSVTPKQTPCHPIPVHLTEVFKQEINKML